MTRTLLPTVVLAWALPAFAQAQAVPATNYTDLWYNPAESGWGVTITQHSPPASPNSQTYAIWYTYDPRAADAATPSNFKPLWIVMSGGTWTSPTSIAGPVYVLNGVPFFQSGSQRVQTQVGTFTFQFSDASHGIFTYNISPPSGIASTDPAYGLPAFSGTKNIERISF
jgi:hypothetical protein